MSHRTLPNLLDLVPALLIFARGLAGENTVDGGRSAVAKGCREVVKLEEVCFHCYWYGDGGGDSYMRGEW